MTHVVSLTATGASPTTAPTVKYLVTFSAPVTGVNASQFTLTANGVSGASIIGVAPAQGSSGEQYVVTVGTGDGDGTLTLSLTGDAIEDLNGDALNPAFLPPTNYATRSGLASLDVETADLNGDGHLDLVSANWDPGFGQSSVSILLGIGNGAFQSASNITAGVGGRAAEIADFNGDGKLDIAGFSAFDNAPDPTFRTTSVSMALGNGNGTFQLGGGASLHGWANSMVAGDLNNDSRSDLVFAKRYWTAASPPSGSFAVSLLLNNGNGTFQSEVVLPTGGEPIGVAIGDFNDDGNADIATTVAASDLVSVFLGNGNGTFQPRTDFATANEPMAVALGDVSGDGELDIVTAGSGVISVLLGDGNGMFQPRLDMSASIFATSESIALRDLNSDGRLDLVLQGPTPKIAVLTGKGDGTFQSPAEWDAGATPASVATGDFNEDGRIDIVGGAGGNLAVLLQGNPSASHTVVEPAVRDDFNGDGRSDILWRQAGGATRLWEMNGTTQTGGGDTTSQTSNVWAIQDTADFNGDGRSDILWRKTDGTTHIWYMDGQTHIGGGNTTAQTSNIWTIQGAGDFTGDGKADILWRRNDGVTHIWAQDGLQNLGPAISGNTSSQNTLAWTIKGIGDFDGDGRSDILWRHDSGTTQIWLMDGKTQIGGGNTNSQPSLIWSIEGVGDFNGDGKDDLLWRHQNGTTAVWFMNGASHTGGGNTNSQTSLAWDIKSVGDYNGDGRSDILWRNDNGSTAEWLMNGATHIGGGLTTSQLPADWAIV